MSFGPIMHLEADNLKIMLAPLAKDDVAAVINNGGMQRHTVSRYMGRAHQAPVFEDELEWFERSRTDKALLLWGVYTGEGDARHLIGSSALHFKDNPYFRVAVSGSALFDTTYWNRGIASAIHRARTWYAFRQMRVVCLRSAVMVENIASAKALGKVGYVVVGQERNISFSDGQYRHQNNLECINPDASAWNSWWHGDTVPIAFRRARTLTRDALSWSEANVTLS